MTYGPTDVPVVKEGIGWRAIIRPETGPAQRPLGTCEDSVRPGFPDTQARATEILRRGLVDGTIRVPHQAIVELVAAVTRPLAAARGPRLVATAGEPRERAMPAIYSRPVYGSRLGAIATAALCAAGLLTLPTPARTMQERARAPLDAARVLAARYPAAPIMSYIPALSWSGALRLSAITGDRQFAEKVRREMTPFLDGTTPAIAEPYLLTSLAGHLAFADLAAMEKDAAAGALARKAADFILPADDGSLVRFPRQWTDDMFMASALLSRVGAVTGDPRYGAAVGRLLIAYAEQLQRPDGLFIHAKDGPHAWGRGNGFALLGLAEALEHLPANWPDRARVLAIYRRHVRGLLPHHSDDGSWRQVVDDPSAYRELTVTAMTVAAMARGVRRGWLDDAYRPVIARGWSAVLARVKDDGSVSDVCSGTGAGPTLDYYLKRPTVNGADDRGGAMALLAALEMVALDR
jgi:rhamnogalacturonyl hydrolase YesR